jgi:hypothetical protein
MHGWIARYEEGYFTNDGECVTLTDELYCDHPWRSPSEAIDQWAARKDLVASGVEIYGNGLQQIDDVHARPEFAVLGVATVWRRVTFRRAAQGVTEVRCQ